LIRAGLTLLLSQRLRREGMQDVEVQADTINISTGQLAALYVLAYPHSLTDEVKMKINKVTLEECASYLQTSHSEKLCTKSTRNKQC
jgi:hypothetical protein